MSDRPKTVVCGTGFGRVYLAGLAAPDSGVELAGVLARGSERSRACAKRYGVPLWHQVSEVPDDVRQACVVVGSAVTGGPGARLADELMERGVDVLQEHPVHGDELAGHLRTARRCGVRYQVNSHHVQVAPIRRFVAAAQALRRTQQPLFVTVTTSVQVLYTVFDILGRALGGIRPWGFDEPVRASAALRELTAADPPFTTVAGAFAGVPLTLQVQHQLDPREPDNHAHLWHRITVGAEGGTLTLVGSAGPVLWCPRPHLPASSAALTGFDELAEPHLGFPAACALGPAEAPDWGAVLRDLWPAAVVRALAEFRSGDWVAAGQYHLALSALVQRLTGSLGPPEMVRRAPPAVLPAKDLENAATEREREEGTG